LLDRRWEGKGGVSLLVEPQRRTAEDLNDTTLTVGGFRRFQDWTVAGLAAITPDADFTYRRALGGEISRRIKGGWTGGLGYRYSRFAGATVHTVMPNATYYMRSGEVALRGYVVRNTALDSGSQAAMVRWLWDASPKVRVTLGAAVGERLFDVSAATRAPQSGWVVFGGPRLHVGTRDAIGAEVRFAHEEPNFDQTAVSLYIRRAF
jgi:YaiO family outer membrane protein